MKTYNQEETGKEGRKEEERCGGILKKIRDQ
jgi:hypothetical protein